MKKIILLAVAVLGFAFAASAQPRAIGGRLGWTTEASYQHTISGTNFVEANLGFLLPNKFGAAATYNFMIAHPEWTSKGEWGFYAGPGAAMNYGWSYYKYNPYTNEDTLIPAAFNIAAMAQVGLEYTFWFPLQLSIDLRPMIGVSIGNEVSLFHEGFFGFAPAISARYRF